MPFCRECGKFVEEEDDFCPKCGASLKGSGYECPDSTGGDDTGGFGWAVLGFFIPVAGLILWLVWQKERPNTAALAGLGALFSVIVTVVVTLLVSIF